MGHSHFSQCPARGAKCNKCEKKGHFAICCKTPRVNPSTTHPSKKRRVNFIDNDADPEEHASEEPTKGFKCFRVGSTSNLDDVRDDLVECELGGVPLTFLIDSGSKANIIKGSDWKLLERDNATLWDVDPQHRDVLKGYGSGGAIKIKHKFQAMISLPGQAEVISNFYVLENGNISLLGKETAKRLGIPKLGVNINRVAEIIPFPKIKDTIVKLTINPNIKPIRQPVRRVPISVEAKVEEKLREALKRDIIEKVKEPSNCVSPIVVTFKSDDDIRICVDMRRANQAILRENYPLPTFDSFVGRIKNAQYFSRLDLTNAYHQLELHEESRYITTFITHKGMYRYKRLMFGVNSAPEIFQRVFEELLSSCKNCWNYLDDIIVWGTTEQEHDSCLKTTLAVLEANNVLLNISKCAMKVKELDFLGHRISNKGIDADDKKIKTIREFRPPTTKEEVRSFLGLVTYLGKFIPDLSTTTEPLRILTKKDEKFVWNDTHQRSFQKLKNSLADLPTLSYFDPGLPTRLIADASPVALGAVLQQFKNQTPQVISFASKSLSSVQRRYSQTEKESLALVWAVERFYYYLSGLEFELVTDHKPLETIFKPSSKPPARIERWVLRLQAYKFKVVYQCGKLNIADSLSRLCKTDDKTPSDMEDELHIYTILEQNTPKAMRISQIINGSKMDPEIVDALGKIADNSWTTADKNAYFPFRFELSSCGSILLRGSKLVIPETCRKQILELAHEGHPGETVMKRRLRAKVWWPQIDRQAEQFVKRCRDCLLVMQPNKPPPMTRHTFPNGPWQCLAIDLMGPLPNHEFVLVVIDYYSRYQELKFLKNITSTVIINCLQELFARLGIPKSIRADNGRQFISQEFKKYCDDHNIELISTPPYWPQANGEGENMNKSILKRLQICHSNNANYKTEIQKFILMYNVTPQGTTGKSPSELLFHRNIRDKIPALTDLRAENRDEEARDNDIIRKQKGKEREDKKRGARDCVIKPGDKVIVKNLIIPHKLTPTFGKTEYEVVEVQGNEVVIMKENRVWKRHISHLKKIPEPVENPQNQLQTASPEPMEPSSELQSPPTGCPNPPSEEETSNCSGEHLDQPAKDAQLPRDAQPPKDQSRPQLKPLKLKKLDGMWRPSDD